MPWGNTKRWGRDTGPWGDNKRWGTNGRWGPGGEVIDWAFGWPLTENLDPDAGDMEAFDLKRVSDRTYVDADGVLRLARGDGEQIWYPSDPSALGGILSGTNIAIAPRTWSSQTENGQTLAYATHILDNAATRNIVCTTNVTLGNVYRLSCYVEMADQSEPTIGGTGMDITMVVAGLPAEGFSAPKLVGGHMWRIVATGGSTVTGSYTHHVRKNTDMSAKGFYCSGFMLEDLG